MKTKNLLLVAIMAFFVMSATAQTWNCGFPNETHVTATLSDSTLVISGTGAMADAPKGRPLWENYNSQITQVVIEDGVTSIGASAFSDCANIISVNISDSVTTIGNYAFSYCQSLTSISFGSGVTDIGAWAFQDCFDLTSVIIPDNVKNIEDGVFSECFNLTSVIIGSGITSFGTWVFGSCSSLETLTIWNPYPTMITLGENIFPSVELKNCTLKVPVGSADRYKNAPVWQDFGDIIEGDVIVDINFPGLENLTVSAGSLSPAFHTLTYNYTMTVPNSVDNITLAATPIGNATASGDGSKTLAVGENTFTILVTTEDGQQNTYTVKITRLVTDYVLTLLDASNITTLYENLSTPIVSGYFLKFQLTTGQYAGNFPLNIDLALNGSKKTVSTNVSVEPNSIYEFTLRINLSNPVILTITIPIDGLGNPGTPYVNDYDFHLCSVVISEGIHTLFQGNVNLPWTLEDALVADFAFIGNGNITSIKELIATPTIKIYPNPATDYISVSGLQNNETLRFYNMDGQLILTRQTSGETENIAVDHFPAGLYFIKTDKGQTLKWVKK